MHLHSSHYFLFVWGAVCLKKRENEKQTNKQTNNKQVDLLHHKVLGNHLSKQKGNYEMQPLQEDILVGFLVVALHTS